MPKHACAESPVPLLIWLGTHGVTAEEGMQLCRAALGDRAAIAVLDPPYRARQRDMSLAGNWFWEDSFSEDMGALVTAIERTWSYVLDHSPVDPQRVCLAGEGTGATVVAATTLLTQRMSLKSVAIAPRQYAKIRDFPLPLLEDWGTGVEKPPARTLHVIGASDDQDWWDGELQQYSAVGLSTEWQLVAEDPWLAVSQSDQTLERALGIAIDVEQRGRAKQYLLVDSDSPRHLLWARLAARRASNEQSACVAVTSPPADATAERLEAAITPDRLAASRAWPKCPGPFGGTTVLVVNEDQLPSWLVLEANDPLQQASGFHRLRIATAGDSEAEAGDAARDEHRLRTVLLELRDQRRYNVLVVPAKFYAGEALMRDLEQQVQGLSDLMTIHWLPGLGGQHIRIGTD